MDAQPNAARSGGTGRRTVRTIVRRIRERGLRYAVTVARIRLRAVLVLLLPRTMWGERLGLRPVKRRLSGAEERRVYHWAGDAEILRWSGGKPTQLSFEEFAEQLRRDRWHSDAFQRLFYIVSRRTGDLVGRIGLYSVNWATREGELGLVLDTPYWGQHLGREAILLLLGHAFGQLHLERVLLGTYKENVRAQRSFAACGFRMTGTATRFNPVSGDREQGVTMEITAEDFARLHPMGARGGSARHQQVGPKGPDKDCRRQPGSTIGRQASPASGVAPQVPRQACRATSHGGWVGRLRR